MKSVVYINPSDGLLYQTPPLIYQLDGTGTIRLPELDYFNVVVRKDKKAVLRSVRSAITNIFDERGFELFDMLDGIKQKSVQEPKEGEKVIDAGKISIISAILRKIVNESKMSASEIGRKIGIPSSSMSRIINLWYTGTSVPTISKVISAAKAQLAIEILASEPK